MTLPDERFRAVIQTKNFLADLCNPKKTPRIPKAIRQQANWCLRHYPSFWDLKRAEQGEKDVFVEKMEDLHKFLLKGKELKG